MDRVSPEVRSEIMRRVRGRDTAPELAVRRLLHAHGYRFRLHRADLPGRPDLFLPRYRTAVFVHGCFWHGHENCKRATVPETQRTFWVDKIRRNRERDREAQNALEATGFRVVTVWQCELRNQDEILRRVDTATGRSKAAA